MKPTSLSNSTRRCATGAAVVVFLLLAGTTSAEDAEIHVTVGAEEIFIGESVDYQVEIRNSKNPEAPDLSDVKRDFEVVAKGDASRNQSSTYIINGRVTQQNLFSHVYHYQLTPKASGSLMIPAVTATIDGKTLTSDTVPLRVIEAEKQDLVLAEIETSHRRVYPTQPFTVVLRLLVQPLPNDSNRDPLMPLRNRPPHLQINWADPPAGLSSEEKIRWLQPLLAEDGIGFTLNDINARTGSFFDGPRSAVFKLSQKRQTRDGLDGDPIRYFVYELTRTLTPQKNGTYSFGPGLVKGTFVAGIERNEYLGRRLVTIAPAVSVEVREVPSPRPSTFCGAIGQYKLSASASPSSLRVGDPLTLTVDLERGGQSGSLELISAPDLSSIPQLTADFELIDKDPTGRTEGSFKKFAYAMRPKRNDVSIPSLTVSTFDPETEKFVDLKTDVIPLVVSEAVALSAGELVGTRRSTGQSSIKTKAEGIFQNVTDHSELSDQRAHLAGWIEAAVGIWCTAGCLVALLAAYRRRNSDAVWVRRQQARRAANRRMTDARTLVAEGKSIDALRQTREAIVGFVADTRNRIAEGLTSSDVENLMLEASIPVEDRTAVSQLLESIESSEYGAAHSADVSSTIETASTLISRIAPRLERGV